MIGWFHALAAFALAFVQGVAVPKNDGWVTDTAGLLTREQESALEALCESYKAGSREDVALLTLPDLGGQPIERVALEVGRAWKMGADGADHAALLVVAKSERELRIEVARGLEGRLTDSISGRIIRDVIAPRLRAGDTYGALRAGLEAMHAALGGDYAALQKAAPRRSPGASAVVFLMLIVFFAIAMRGRRGGGRMPPLWMGPALGGLGRGFGGGLGGGGGFGGGFSGFGGGGGGFRGGGASGGW